MSAADSVDTLLRPIAGAVHGQRRSPLGDLPARATPFAPGPSGATAGAAGADAFHGVIRRLGLSRHGTGRCPVCWRSGFRVRRLGDRLALSCVCGDAALARLTLWGRLDIVVVVVPR